MYTNNHHLEHIPIDKSVAMSKCYESVLTSTKYFKKRTNMNLVIGNFEKKRNPVESPTSDIGGIDNGMTSPSC